MFKDRIDAGKKLSSSLLNFRGQNVIVYGLTRGGVPVAYEVAKALEAPLEAFIVKKIGAPYQEELALGAITEGKDPILYFNRELMVHLQVLEEDLQEIVRKRKTQIVELGRFLRQDGELLVDTSATAIIVDDGVATGSTIKAAVLYFRKIGQNKIIVAVPVCQLSVMYDLEKVADKVVCKEPVSYMEAVGEFYEDFKQVENEVVLQILLESRKKTEVNE